MAETDKITKQSGSLLERLADNNQLATVSFDEIAQSGQAVDVSDEIGEGFHVLSKDDKAKLVGVPFVILKPPKFNDGDIGEFVTLHVLTTHDELLILNDGSTGIYQQMRDYMKRVDEDLDWKPVLCKRGLRKSEYTPKDAYGNPLTNSKGEEVKATTYYLDTMA